MMLEIAYGRATLRSGEKVGRARESLWLVVGPAGLALLVLALGLYIPPPLQEMLGRAAAMLGGRAP
jgi:hypothetical protein